MPISADYTYDRDADCFVVTDDTGNEICRTRAPHEGWHHTYVSYLVHLINDGTIILSPPTGDTSNHVG